ncbi:ZIP family metal transporter [Robertkochia marina]|uniref:ZIP family metal transporter n=1 Tax=Robertkochia marina TaxID=1227945 RepID=A0A4S3LY55_9FLAO|nr:ZIP family metal transporter [Robertkochia marina]THD66509.1 ZIP family metal transporter [Robertkochia marina]TRZ45652.1 ZIP family metal transporter [Robertkochia marina]
MNYLLPILAVFTGYLVALAFTPKNREFIKLFLAFSGAFLLSVTVFELLPHLFGHHVEHTETQHRFDKYLGIWIMAGILLQIFLEFFSKGAEHGHMHLNRELNQFPWPLFLSLSLHAFLEGFPIADHDLLVYGIVIHKLPVAIILSAFFIQSSISKWKTAVFLLLFSLMTPLGTLVAEHTEFIQPIYLELQALTIGIFLHVSTVILFESSEGHKFNINKLLVIVLGVTMAYMM